MILIVSTRVNGRDIVQKAADGSVYKLWYHFSQSVQFYKPWKDREDQCSSTMPNKI